MIDFIIQGFFEGSTKILTNGIDMDKMNKRVKIVDCMKTMVTVILHPIGGCTKTTTKSITTVFSSFNALTNGK